MVSLKWNSFAFCFASSYLNLNVSGSTKNLCHKMSFSRSKLASILCNTGIINKCHMFSRTINMFIALYHSFFELIPNLCYISLHLLNDCGHFLTLGAYFIWSWSEANCRSILCLSYVILVNFILSKPIEIYIKHTHRKIMYHRYMKLLIVLTIFVICRFYYSDMFPVLISSSSRCQLLSRRIFSMQ